MPLEAHKVPSQDKKLLLGQLPVKAASGGNTNLRSLARCLQPATKGSTKTNKINKQQQPLTMNLKKTSSFFFSAKQSSTGNKLKVCSMIWQKCSEAKAAVLYC